MNKYRFIVPVIILAILALIGISLWLGREEPEPEVVVVTQVTVKRVEVAVTVTPVPYDATQPNLCNEGQALAGRCDDPGDWKGGWYAYRWKYDCQPMPAEFEYLLKQIAKSTWQSSKCRTGGGMFPS